MSKLNLSTYEAQEINEICRTRTVCRYFVCTSVYIPVISDIQQYILIFFLNFYRILKVLSIHPSFILAEGRAEIVFFFYT